MKENIKNILCYYNIDKKIYLLHLKGYKNYLKGNNFLAQQKRNKIYKRYNCWIESSAKIGNNISFPHPMGIVIGASVIIGDNCTIYQNVTLGRKNKDIVKYPTIGNDVTIYANSTIIGDVKIGNNATI